MKKFIISALAVSTMFATDITPYISTINYNKNTNKDYADIVGLYISQYQSPYKVEIDGEYMRLKYKDSPDYKQSDLTVIVNYFYEKNYKYRIGIHNIFASNPETIVKYQPGSFGTSSTTTVTKYNNSYDYVLFGGITYYKYLKYDADLNLYYSKYQDLDVIQISPSYGYSFGNYYSSIGSFYLKGTFNYINLSNSSAAPKKNYSNFDVKLQNYNGSWITTLEGSFGKSAYKVSKDGFVVYNLGEEYKNSYSLTVGNKFQKNDFISGSINYSTFEETPGYEASSISLLIKYTHNF